MSHQQVAHPCCFLYVIHHMHVRQYASHECLLHHPQPLLSLLFGHSCEPLPLRLGFRQPLSCLQDPTRLSTIFTDAQLTSGPFGDSMSAAAGPKR
jgi:hypothetical protein